MVICTRVLIKIRIDRATARASMCTQCITLQDKLTSERQQNKDSFKGVYPTRSFPASFERVFLEEQLKTTLWVCSFAQLL